MTPQGAFAAGRPGLWTVTTVWQFGMPVVPPALAALVRQQKLIPPTNGQPFTHYMCMTKEEAGGSPTDAETRKAARSPEVRAFCDDV